MMISSSGTGEISQWQGLGPAQPAQKVAQPMEKGTKPQHPAPNGHLEKPLERSVLLQKLTVSREETPREEIEGGASFTLILKSSNGKGRLVLCGV